MRRAAKVDANHAGIAKAFMDMGCSVVSLAQLGNGIPDLIVACSKTALVEIKDGSKPPSKQRLNELQTAFHANWKGKIFICKSIVEVPGIVERLR